MNAHDIRAKYLEFMRQQGHAVIPRALLVPHDDPTTLFTGSGMQPLLPYLLGQDHPAGSRLADSQTCLRAQDIDEVGDNRHTTFFEMLGNWSLGDYGKHEQLPWFFGFLVDTVGLRPERLYVSCFIGDEAAGINKDVESAGIWHKLFEARGVEAGEVEIGSEADGAAKGMRGGRIFYYDAGKNWWCRAGNITDMPAGEPGGPDSEVFYEFDFIEHDPAFGEHCHPNCDCGRFMEIGNSVFMEYVRTEDGFDKLPKQNVDFGGGLERIAAAAMNDPDVFGIGLLKPIIDKLEAVSNKDYQSHTNAMRVIADHLRAAVFLAADGVKPSNKAQGYVMRRLMRRAMAQAFDLGVEQNFMPEVVPVIADLYKADFPEVSAAHEQIMEVLVKEEKAFRQTLRKGLREFTKLAGAELSGEAVFTLYDTYGFPTELSYEEAFKQNVPVAAAAQGDFERRMAEQRQRSQTAAKGTFKGGLGGQTMQHKKYHTATHLMYQSLRMVLGDHVVQHGSNITEERLRFDFSHPDKLTAEQIGRVEDMVNQQIDKDLTVTVEEHPTGHAIDDLHVLGAFGDRYGDIVTCYRMQAAGADQPFSFEICGGPHVDHTAQLAEPDRPDSPSKRFKIVKETSSSAGIRRIKAVLR